MRKFFLELIAVDARNHTLRLRALEGRDQELWTRPVSDHELTQLIERTSQGSRGATRGHQIWEWFNAGTARWGDRLREGVGGVELHVDVSTKLRVLPWELLHDGAEYLVVSSRRPWSIVRRVGGISTRDGRDIPRPSNRPLCIFFSASQPRGLSAIRFETEEANIIEATREWDIRLIVEESGTASGLEHGLRAMGEGALDALHVSCHGGLLRSGPILFFEDSYGGSHELSPEQFHELIRDVSPKLLVLSACETALSLRGRHESSMCEQLAEMGAPAVIGWDDQVADHDAIAASKQLYGALASGSTLAQAVARARRKLFDAGVRSWHLLRLFMSSVAPEALVTPLNTPGRLKPTPGSSSHSWASGPNNDVQARFVGRRRELQRSLFALRQDPKRCGVLLRSAMGYGKSALIGRLCRRMEVHSYRQIHWTGVLDELSLIDTLRKHVSTKVGQVLLGDEPLQWRLEGLLREAFVQAPALFIFDAFEQNTPVGQPGVKKQKARDALSALLAAIRAEAPSCRVIVASRHAIELDGQELLELIHVPAMEGSDLVKWLRSDLDQQAQPAMAEPEVVRQAVAVTGGIPRLLNRLDRADPSAWQEQSARLTAEYYDDAGLEGLLERVGANALLARLSLVELPVGIDVFRSLAENLEFDEPFSRALDLGLIEASQSDISTPAYRVCFAARRVLRLAAEPDMLRNSARRIFAPLHAAWWADRQQRSDERAIALLNLIEVAALEPETLDLRGSVAARWNEMQRHRDVLWLGERYSGARGWRFLHELTRAEFATGPIERARRHLSELSQLIAERPGDAKEALLIKAREQENSAEVLKRDGNFEAACEVIRKQVLPLYRERADELGYALALSRLGDLLRHLERYEEALEVHRDCELPLYARQPDPRHRLLALSRIARLQCKLGQLDEARAVHEQQLELYQSTGSGAEYASVLGHLADTWLEVDRSRARQLREEQLRRLEQLEQFEVSRQRAVAAGKLATILALDGENEQSIALRRTLELPVYARMGDGAALKATQVKIVNALQRLQPRERAHEILRELRDESPARYPMLDATAWRY